MFYRIGDGMKWRSVGIYHMKYPSEMAYVFFFFSDSFLYKPNQTHMLHVWYIYLQNLVIYGVTVGVHIPAPWVAYGIWVCLKMVSTPKPNGFADHYPYEKWLFHWGYTPFSDKHRFTIDLPYITWNSLAVMGPPCIIQSSWPARFFEPPRQDSRPGGRGK